MQDSVQVPEGCYYELFPTKHAYWHLDQQQETGV